MSAVEAVKETIEGLQDPARKLPLEEDAYIVKHLKKALERKERRNLRDTCKRSMTGERRMRQTSRPESR